MFRKIIPSCTHLGRFQSNTSAVNGLNSWPGRNVANKQTGASSISNSIESLKDSCKTMGLKKPWLHGCKRLGIHLKHVFFSRGPKPGLQRSWVRLQSFPPVLQPSLGVTSHQKLPIRALADEKPQIDATESFSSANGQR